MNFSVVIPLYNEEQAFAALRQAVEREVHSATWGESAEIVLVDDGSSDQTPSMIRDWVDVDPRVTGVLLTGNRGQAEAIRAGVLQARGDYVVIMDADLQDPPELIGPMLGCIGAAGADQVVAQRSRRIGENLAKRFSAWIYYRMMGVLLPHAITPDAGEFRLVGPHCIRKLRVHQGPVPIMRFYWDAAARTTVTVPYTRPGRVAGESHYSWPKMLSLAFSTLADVSSRRMLAFILSACLSLAVLATGMLLPGAVMLVAALTFCLTGSLALAIGVAHAKTRRYRPLVASDFVLYRGSVRDQVTKAS